jgi:hypothetical protein
MSVDKYINDPFLYNLIKDYPNNFDEATVKKIKEYFRTKKSLRNGKPINCSTKVQQISKLKNTLKKIQYKPELEDLAFPKLTKKVNRKQVDTLIKRHTTIIQIEQRVIDDILKGIDSNNVGELYTALLLACGRRATEIYMMRPQNSKKLGEYEYLFKNQLKKRDDRSSYKITLLVPREKFNKALKKFHKLSGNNPKDNLSAEELSNKYKNHNYNYMKMLNQRYDIVGCERLKTSDLRRLYVYELYNRSDKTESINNFVMNNLGHEELNTSLNYTNIKII